MKRLLILCFSEECGQDLSEYAMLIAFSVVAVVAVAGCFQPGIKAITNASNSNLAAANTAIYSVTH
jgi:hypothetical protein